MIAVKDPMHGRSKRSGWSGFGPTTLSQTERARAHLNTRVRVRTAKLWPSRKTGYPTLCKFH